MWINKPLIRSALAMAALTSLIGAVSAQSNDSLGHNNMLSALADEPVDMMLCLAADVSESVTKTEYRLQKQGHTAAISDPRVVNIIQNGLHGRVAALYVEWADQDQQFLGAD